MRKSRMVIGIVLAVMFAMAAASTVTVAAELKVLAVPVLKFTINKVGEIKLVEALGGKVIVCAGVTGSGEFTAERKGSIEFKFTECKEKLTGFKCTGLTDGTTGSITFKTEFDVRHLLPNSEGVDIALLFGTIHFSCLGVLLTVSGCAASADMVTKAGGESVVNKSVERAYLAFLQEKGDQKVTSIDTDGSLGMEECVTKLKQEAGASEGGGVLLELELEKFELGPVSMLVELAGTF